MLVNFVYDGYSMDYQKNDKSIDKVHFNKVIEVDTKNKTMFDSVITDNSMRKHNYQYAAITKNEFVEMC